MRAGTEPEKVLVNQRLFECCISGADHSIPIARSIQETQRFGCQPWKAAVLPLECDRRLVADSASIEGMSDPFK
jgi:hypothetical protein